MGRRCGRRWGRAGALAGHRGGSDCRRGHRHRLWRRRYCQRRAPGPGAEAVSLAPGGGHLRHRQATPRASLRMALSGRLRGLQPQRTVPRTASAGGADVVHARDRPALLRDRKRVGRARRRHARTRLLHPHPPHGAGPDAPRPHAADGDSCSAASTPSPGWVTIRHRSWRRTGSPAAPSCAGCCWSTDALRCICSRPGCSSTPATTRSPRRADSTISWSCGSAPGSPAATPYRYAELHATLRFYQQVVADRLVLAARAVGYLQIGDVPFYELSRYDETSALGGAKGVRGIPKDRYYGKRKLFGNLEARGRLVTFRAGAAIPAGTDRRSSMAGGSGQTCAPPPSSTAGAGGSNTAWAAGCGCRRDRPSCCGSTWPGRPTPGRSGLFPCRPRLLITLNGRSECPSTRPLLVEDMHCAAFA